MPAANVAAHKSAFEASLRLNGEAVTFVGSRANLKTVCLINRSKNRPAWKAGANTDAPGGATVWFRANLSEPKRGEVFTDSYGREYRIEDTTPLVHAWECEAARAS